MASERLQVILDMETGSYRRKARQASDSTKEIGTTADRASRKLGDLTGRFKGLALAVGGAAIGAALVDSVRAATDLTESMNAVERTFGSASDQVLAFGDVSAQVAGLSKSAFQEMATVTGSLLTNFGLSASQAADEATKLTVRAADLASVFNTDVSVAMDAINSALQGQSRPLRQFGVSLSDAQIRAKAVELGLADTTAAVDNNGKAVATLELIYEQTNKVQGDFLQTSNDLANAQRIAAAEFENAKARLGQGLTPVLANAAGFASDLLLSLQTFSDDEVMANAAKESLRFGEALDAINDAIEGTEDPLTQLADGLLHIAREGELTEAQFRALAAAAGLSEEQFEDFARIVVEQGESMGLSAELIAELESAILGTGDAADDAAPGMGALGDETGETADETERLTRATINLATELRKQADPVFKAFSALEKYQSVLQDIDEDSERTAAEMLELAEASIDAEEALRDLGGGDLAGGIQAIAIALGISADEARDLLRELNILDGTTVTSVINLTTNRSIRDAGTTASGRTAVSGRAHGGPMSPNEPYIVGEQGIELVIPNTQSFVVPNNQLGGLGTTVTNYVSVAIDGATYGGDPAAFAKGIAREMDRALVDLRGGKV